MPPSIVLAFIRVRKATATLVPTIALVLLFAQIGGRAQTFEPLSYGGGILVTGDYAVGTLDLTSQQNPPDSTGLATGTIHMAGIPPDADILSADLYWEAITFTASPQQATATFRGHSIDINDAVAVKKSHQDLVGNAASCWTSGQPVTMWRFRADVLRFLPIRLDKNNQPTTKHLVNDADLTANGQLLHTVVLPTRSGNQLPESAGAALIVVYREPSQPLRKVVFYDGIHIQDSLTDTMTQTLRGFYRSSATKSARVTFLTGSGQPNSNERFFFNDGAETQVSPPNPITAGSSSERAWSALTYTVSNLMNPGNNSGDGYGETAIAKMDHSGGGGNDCLTWEGVVFSTAVADTDPNNDGGALGDGIPDGLEDAAAGLRDPDGQLLPNLNAMGASSAHRDLFIEVNAMWAAPGTTYGSASAPYDSTHLSVTDTLGHSHMPTPDDIKAIGDKYSAHGIVPHFDVGDISAYHALGVIVHQDWVDDYTVTNVDPYLVPSSLARGGEIIKERACDPAHPPCTFPDYPGVVSWKLGMEIYRDYLVRDDGTELTFEELTDPANPGYFDWNAGAHRRRFDRNRFGLFHYLLYAHTRGKPKSPLPCLVGGQPAPYDTSNGTACTTNNPDFHVPSSSSGIADLPGGNAMVSLGRWDEFVGRPFVRASTAFHELGHNLNLWHGGLPATWGNHALNTATYFEPNCKTPYLSSMSYAFQVHGLFDDLDNINFDYSGAAENNVTESIPQTDGPLGPVPTYRPVWYVPANSALAASQGASAAVRYCTGGKFDPTQPAPSMARVSTQLASDAIDWNGDQLTNAANAQQDTNFDAAISGTLFGFNDWTNLALNQISADRWIAVFGGGFVDTTGGFVDTTGGFVDTTGGFIDSLGGFQDTTGGFVDSLGGFVDTTGGFQDTTGGFQDTTGGFVDTTGGSVQEVDFEAAKGAGRGTPYGLLACIISGGASCPSVPPFTLQYHARQVSWHPPSFGHVFQYLVSRKRGNAGSTFPFVSPVPTSTTSSQTFVDTEQLPNGVPFTYRTRGEYDDLTPHPLSGFSRTVTITAVNEAPVANADPSYTTSRNRVLRVTTQATGVLGNDTDVDSPASFIKAVRVAGPSNGTLTLNSDGTFTYTPRNGFTGVDTFTYKANNGFWSADATVPLSSDSATVLVTITVTR